MPTWVLKASRATKLIAVNKGATVPFDDLGFAVTMTHADHTSSIKDNGNVLYGGEPMGFVLHIPDGDETFTIYHAGDTAIFGDMRLISEIYTPRLALLPNRRSLHDGTARSRRCIRATGIG